MRRHLLIAFSGLYLSLPTSGFAQQPTVINTAHRAPIAVQILQSTLVKSPSAQNLLVRAAIAGPSTSQDTSMALTLKVLDPRNLRTETTIKGTQRTVANSAGVAVRYENGEREGAVPLWISAFQRQDLLPTVSIAKDLQDDSVSIEYLGTEDYAGRKVHHIRFWSTRLGEIEPDVVEQLSSFHVYIDAETLLVLKTSRRVSAVDTYTNYSILENRYDDYVEQAGVLLPRKIDQFMAGARVSQITVLGVERAELNAADFK